MCASRLPTTCLRTSPPPPLQDSWSATVQLVLLVFTALVALGLVPLLLMTTNRFMGGSMFSPVKTPTASATQVGAGGWARVWVLL